MAHETVFITGKKGEENGLPQALLSTLQASDDKFQLPSTIPDAIDHRGMDDAFSNAFSVVTTLLLLHQFPI